MSPNIRKAESKDYGIDTGCGKMDIVFRLDKDKKPVNCKIFFGKSGVCGTSQTEAISRLVKILLKNNVALEAIIKQLKGIHCSSQTRTVTSCADAVAQSLEELRGDLSVEVKEVKKETQ